MTLAIAKYECKTDKGKNYIVEAKLVEHGGFDYGNGHSIVLKEDDVEFSEILLDARYDGRFNTVEKFFTHIIEVMKDWYNIAEYKLLGEYIKLAEK